MKKLLLLFTGTCVLFAFSGCSKDEEPTPTPKKTNEEILISTTWKMTAATVTPAYDWYDDGNLITDVFAVFYPCEKDDFDNYNANKTYIIDEGPTKCDPADPQTQSGTWSMSSDQTQLYLDGGMTYIKSMSETQMVWTNTWDENGTTYTVLITYSKK